MAKRYTKKKQEKYKRYKRKKNKTKRNLKRYVVGIVAVPLSPNKNISVAVILI